MDLFDKRGEVDLNVVASIKLAPYKPDLRYLMMLDRRQQLEGMRDEPTDESVAEDQLDHDQSDVEETLSALQNAMEDAVQKEDYEGAAKLRDQIRQLEQDRGNNDGLPTGEPG